MVALMKCYWWRLVIQGLSILAEVHNLAARITAHVYNYYGIARLDNTILQYSTIILLFQTAILVCQSIVLGLLTDYFSIEAPTSEDTRSAYLYALGKQIESFKKFLVHVIRT